MQRKAEVPLSDIEQAKAAAKVATLTSAEMQLSEELDDVKKMNQMMLYAKVVTIRDAQVPASPSPSPLALTPRPHLHPPWTGGALRRAVRARRRGGGGGGRGHYS